ncbi:thioredoxin domain-containing protein [Terrimonas sp. NA20]|uniref:Thioredoxin domain-containing protein n=1 Tax=Terrimonas ginsenosidimutans TaxID=2908004 RepID=A0ABS9KP89_9BACT|nr:thioredoxin domain-containing protein [Terrimonas ginsenosidimutans]MCG2614148.1 thioredoxin domain-containing protein [Terrimonas ginsenosidimutans]
MHQHTNHLINETSPYLLQHAHNPVQWYPWGEEALKRAKEEDKPILVSIGYAACHWCHVMERESFEDESTAELMNEHFINIKIDREERPDLDHIYMDAVQAMSGSGGWPLNVFLTPDTRPFYGGTYFPPVRAFNRASWKEVLAGVANGFYKKREEIESQANNLTTHLLNANSFGLQNPAQGDAVFTTGNTDQIAENCLTNADTVWGGFGRAPKFPQSFTIRYLLRYYHVKKTGSGNQFKELAEPGLQQALLSLDKMIEGGIYDQLGGGFARYSTDAEWLAPHFEKMLYDNALLVDVLAEAYQLTGKKRYAEVISETIGFVKRELMAPGFGFYAALDADSEGEEGKFYVWQKEEVEQLLAEEAPAFCGYYDISEKGNWNEPGHTGSKNILRVLSSWEEIATQFSLTPDELKQRITRGKNILLEARSHRVRPALDDKIILGWNALMNKACSKAFAATGDEQYRELAVANMKFLLEKFTCEDGGYYHTWTWKNEQAKYPAFLDDYSFLADALLHLQEITGDATWLEEAAKIVDHLSEQFSEEETGYFFFTGKDQTDVIIRKKEVYDGAVASGNAVMASVLHHLGILLDRADWRERSDRMVNSLGQAIVRHPTSFGYWASQVLERATGTAELAIVGTGRSEIYHRLLRAFTPHAVMMGFDGGASAYPLLNGKSAGGPVKVFVCRDFACQQPVSTYDEAISLINKSVTV